MKQDDVYASLARKLSQKKESLKDIRLSDGKIYFEYFKRIFKEINASILENKRAIKPNEEFSHLSNDPWAYVNKDAPIIQFAHLLAVPCTRSAALIRADCTRPRISEAMLTAFLADQMEKNTWQIDLDDKVRTICLPVANNNKHSWLTFVKWCESMGFKGHPQDADVLAEMTIRQLFAYWVR